MNNDDIMLSIYVPTYCHEKYISRALDSILMQKTSYKYEVLVGDDASPDGTREILKKYEEKYPGKFKMFYRSENMYGKIPNNARDLQLRCVGKYIIGLEGDDYWISDTKIEKQISFLENNPEYIAVAHNCVVVDENDNVTGEKYPECKDEIYTLEHFVSEIMPGQLTTVMARNYVKYNFFDTSILNKGLVPGDRLLYFALAAHGKVYCMQETMSAYRHVVKKGSTSFSSNYRYVFEKEENWYGCLMEYAKNLESNKAYYYAEMLYFRNIFYGLRYRQLPLNKIMTYFNKIEHKNKAVSLFFKQLINHKIFKKSIWV
ncbi:glycosyltransferase [Acetivibrio clariflavus]|uniref:glycosyltransferase n=1 Tax=Acetivibrio clariflavus TaxID=288965 RepID=UPI0031F5028B